MCVVSNLSAPNCPCLYTFCYWGEASNSWILNDIGQQKTPCWDTGIERNSQIFNEDFYLPLYLPLWPVTYIWGWGAESKNDDIGARGEDAAHRLTREHRRHVGGRKPPGHAKDPALNRIILLSTVMYRYNVPAFYKSQWRDGSVPG